MSEGATASVRNNGYIFISGILAVIGIFGLISNCVAMVATRRNPVLHNAFGMLCFSHSIANFGVMVVFVFWVTPITLFQSHLSTRLIGKIMGQILIMFWDVCVYSHLLISVNRIIAITLPHRASVFFSTKRTGFMLVAVWMLGFGHVIPYFWETCYIYYDASKWSFLFADTKCGFVISTYTDNYTSSIVLILIFLLDCTTLFRLRRTNNIINAGNTVTINTTAQRKRRHTEIRFFMQTLYQNLLFFYEMSNFYYVSTLFENQWMVFLTSTIPWEACHAFDGNYRQRTVQNLRYELLSTQEVHLVCMLSLIRKRLHKAEYQSIVDVLADYVSKA